MFFGEAKADPDKMSRFLTEYTQQGWEVKTMAVERRRSACSGRAKRIYLCLNAPSDALIYFIYPNAILVNRLFRLTRYYLFNNRKPCSMRTTLAHK